MTDHEIEIWRLAQVLDDVMAYSKGTPMVTDAQWRDIVTMIQDECPKAYDKLVDRFEDEFGHTKPCMYCEEHDHAAHQCPMGKAEAQVMRTAQAQEEDRRNGLL